jgi:hypothetical protein
MNLRIPAYYTCSNLHTWRALIISQDQGVGLIQIIPPGRANIFAGRSIPLRFSKSSPVAGAFFAFLDHHEPRPGDIPLSGTAKASSRKLQNLSVLHRILSTAPNFALRHYS